MRKINQSGMTLTELMIAIGVAAGLLLATLEIQRYMGRVQSTAQQGQESTSMLYEVDRIVSNEPVCTAALLGVSNVNGTNLTLAPNITAGAKYGKISMTSVKLENVTLIASPNYSADIELLGMKADSTMGTREIVKRTRVFYSVDASNNIDKCLSSGRTPAADCSAMGGTWNVSRCDFCAQLGGVTQPDGTCNVLGASIYGWQADSWSVCMAGTQTRTIDCVDNNTSAVVADSFCTTTKPPLSRTCTSYVWDATPWSTCTANTKTRTVQCTDTGTGTAVADSFCSPNGPKPISTDTCSNSGCVPVTKNYSTYTAQGHYYANTATTDLKMSYPGKMPAADETAARAAYDTLPSSCTMSYPGGGETMEQCQIVGSTGKISWNIYQHEYNLNVADCPGGVPCPQYVTTVAVTLCVDP